jgi:predicted MFS family arabinose efflux permease
MPADGRPAPGSAEVASSGRAASASPGSAGQPALTQLGLITVLIGIFLPVADFFIVNVALPTIDGTLHASAPELQLVVAGYGIAYSLLLVLGGRLGDAWGRRRLFLGGMAAFTVSSLACGLAPSALFLVASRAVQGASAAMMLPQVLATIQAASTGRRRARALGLYGATGGIANVVGQVLGGVLVSANIAGTSWRPIFLVNVPVGIAGLVLAARVVPDSRPERPARADLPGTVLLGAAVLTLMVPLMEGRSLGWPAWTVGMLVAFPFLALAFAVSQRRQERAGRLPLVPPSLVRERSMRNGLLLAVPFFTSFGAFMFVYTIAAQQGLRFSPLTAGIALVPLAVCFLGASLAMPRLVARYGRLVITAGAVITVVSMLVLAAVTVSGWPRLGPLDLAPGMALVGIGNGLVLPPLFRVVLSGVPADRAGVGGGVLVTTQQTSLALGVATLGSLFLSLEAPGGPGLRTAFTIVLLVLAAAAVLVAVISLRLPDDRG